MKAKEYDVLEMAVEQGVMWGWQHAHKHNPEPSEAEIKERIVNDVMNEICGWFDFKEIEERNEPPI